MTFQDDVLFNKGPTNLSCVYGSKSIRILLNHCETTRTSLKGPVKYQEGIKNKETTQSSALTWQKICRSLTENLTY